LLGVGLVSRFATVLVLSACNATPDPDLPAPIDHVVIDFSVAYSRVGIVFEGGANTPFLDFVGGAPPAPADGEPRNDVGSQAIALGRRHACVIGATGSVHCWGNHEGNALGDHRACISPPAGGPPNCLLEAGVIPTLPPARAIAAGDDITCAITEADDYVYCWGDDELVASSRLPAGDPAVPVVVETAPLVASRVIVAHRTVCAIDQAAALWCWGDGFGRAPARQPYTNVLDVAFGRLHSCVVEASGLRCSGDNRNGQVGDIGHARACGDGACELADHAVPIDAIRVAVGERHTCALEREGQVICFGSNEVGQLGRSDAFLTGDLGNAVIDDATELASGFAHVCARRRDRSVWCWGDPEANDPREGAP
jgi:hypothetical protein